MFNYVALPFVDLTGVEVDFGELVVKIRATDGDSTIVYGTEDGSLVNIHPLKTNATGQLEVVATGTITSDSHVYGYDGGGATWEKINEFTDGAGDTALVVHDDDAVTELQAINSLIPAVYDYVEVTYPLATREIYVFKSGGAGGATISTLTMDYTDATKENLSTLART